MSFNSFQNNNWKFVLQRNPNLEFRCTYVSIPGITLSPTQMPTPNVSIPFWGDHVQYDQLNVQFILDEYLETYMELLKWMEGLGRIPTSEAFKLLRDSKNDDMFKGLKSEITISLLTSAGKENRSIVFHDAFPIFLGGFELTTQNTDINIITSRVSFAYTYYSLI